eukprot:COSAG01_NODE_485_length_16397_cov_48.193827_26_plen_86_part_00
MLARHSHPQHFVTTADVASVKLSHHGPRQRRTTARSLRDDQKGRGISVADSILIVTVTIYSIFAHLPAPAPPASVRAARGVLNWR